MPSQKSSNPDLNDSLLRYFQSVPERVLQEEHYHWWAEFGVKLKF